MVQNAESASVGSGGLLFRFTRGVLFFLLSTMIQEKHGTKRRERKCGFRRLAFSFYSRRPFQPPAEKATYRF
ncbi:Uncharacterised protein [Salmonella enterica subsp. enterica serovar Typhi]|nr:Uncharacterised protein [Salmonella enterica subsp. enterica serovar Typhi]